MTPTFDAVYETLPANGWLTRLEAESLWDAAQATTGPILEVGSYYGRSTVLLAALGRLVYAVDPFAGFDSDDPEGDMVAREFQGNLKSRGIQNVILSRKRIEDWDRARVGFAYLDGDHTYRGTLTQIKVAVQCAAKVVCVHDYAQSGGGVHVAKAIGDSRELELVKVVERMAVCRVRERGAVT